MFRMVLRVAAVATLTVFAASPAFAQITTASYQNPRTVQVQIRFSF